MSPEMLHLAKKALENAYAPYSKFHVGCCIKTANGNYFFGANVENFVYPSSQCAEASAIGAMVSNGENKIAEILMLSEKGFCAPCGNCRQKLSEFSEPSTKVHIFDASGHLKTILFGELLPHMFYTEAL